MIQKVNRGGVTVLTIRQIKILESLINNNNEYYTSNQLAQQFNVSIRTIKSDLKEIKNFSETNNNFKIESLPSKGTKLIIHDKKALLSSLNELTRKVDYPNKDNVNRANELIKKLASANTYISKYSMMESLYISESTLYQTVNEAKQKLKEFNLNISYKTNHGYFIEGDEVDIRRYIMVNNQCLNNSIVINEEVARIYNIIANSFVDNKYQINEKNLQNITMHVALTIQRVKDGNYVNIKNNSSLKETIEYQISENILNHLLIMYNIDRAHLQNEVQLLTQTILGKTEYYINDSLQDQINDIINSFFIETQSKFSVNFCTNENLKLFLALHVVPMIYRIKSHTTLVNEMSSEIRQSFPIGYDIALDFSTKLSKIFDIHISEDELSYLTLYFNYGIENLNLGGKSRRILIFTNLRKSETILLKHKILNWFPNQISEITFLDSNDQNVDLSEYDAIFSTDDDVDKFKGGVTKINVFPDEKDFNRINLSINGYTDEQSILKKFNSQLFRYGKVKDKKEALNILCQQAKNIYSLPNDFQNSIETREDFSATYFNNLIAMPHPLSPITDETFVSVLITEEPIRWNSTHEAQVIMLISIEKNNPRAFQFWHYVSCIVQNESKISKIIQNPTYDNFIKILKESLKSEFSN